MSHFTLTIILALLVSVTASPRRLQRTVWMFTCCIASVIGGSWAMYLIHG